MKKSFQITFVFVFMLCNYSISQENNDASTLFGNGSVSAENLGFFIAPAYGLTQMDGSTTSLFHVRAGMSIKDKTSFGGYFSTSINEIVPVSETVQGVYMDYWTVGGFAEYTLFSKKIFHVTFPVSVGYGEVQMDNEIGDAGLGEANFFQVEPSAQLEINLHKNVRLNIGAGYRFVGEMSYRNFDHTDISGPTGYAGLKIGLFK